MQNDQVREEEATSTTVTETHEQSTGAEDANKDKAGQEAAEEV